MVVVDGNKQAEALSEAVDTFFDLLAADDRGGPQLLPALDVLPLQNLSPHAEICEQRAIGLWRLATQRVPITILPVASALLRIEPARFLPATCALRLRVGEELPLDEVVAHLESIGYERREPVEMVGEYSVRGGILDVFSPEAAEAGPHRPVRRPGGVDPPLRRGVAALRPEGRGVHAAAADGVSEVARAAGAVGRPDARGRHAGARLPPPGEPFPGWELLAPMVRPRQRFGLRPAGPADRGLGRAGAGPRRRRAVLEAPGTDRALRRPTIPSGSSSIGRSWSARRPSSLAGLS